MRVTFGLKAFDLETISQQVPCCWEGKNLVLEGISSVDRAGPGELTFLKSRTAFKGDGLVRAGACFVREQDKACLSASTVALVVPDPWLSFVQALRYLTGLRQPLMPFRHATAVIHEESIVHASCVVEAHVVIRQGVVIEEGCILEAGAVIGPDVRLGKNCSVGAHSTIAYADLEDDVIVKSGARIGQAGFGFIIQDQKMLDVPHEGRVFIGQGTHIGANTTVDRAVMGATHIGKGCRIDNLVHVAHNCRLGNYVVIAAQTGLSGSCTLEDGCALGGQVGLSPHVTLGPRTQVAAKSGVMRSCPGGMSLAGIPAVSASQWRRQVAELWQTYRSST
jgi:UDP-3-O-[3-hydroxymyristoyl] glucosamine N-acyltransferase